MKIHLKFTDGVSFHIHGPEMDMATGLPVKRVVKLTNEQQEELTKEIMILHAADYHKIPNLNSQECSDLFEMAKENPKLHALLSKMVEDPKSPCMSSDDKARLRFADAGKS